MNFIQLTKEYLLKEYGEAVTSQVSRELESKQVGSCVKDSEGNQFVIDMIYKDGVDLRGIGGCKSISIHDLKFYSKI